EVPSGLDVEAVLREWAARLEDPAWQLARGVETIYFGGGTPSRLEPAAIEALLDGVRGDRTLAVGAEVTLEANPDDVNPAAASAWRAAGINRLSLGAQSCSTHALRWMHRTH